MPARGALENYLSSCVTNRLKISGETNTSVPRTPVKSPRSVDIVNASVGDETSPRRSGDGFIVYGATGQAAIQSEMQEYTKHDWTRTIGGSRCMR